jgi:hypothetical protein
MTAILRYKNALRELQVDEGVIAKIFAGYENLTDQSRKETRAAFFIQAIQRMEECLGVQVSREVRDACACSKGGWRLKAVQKVARETVGMSLEEKLAALNQIPHLGNPVLSPDGSLTAHIGELGGFECPCPVFQGSGVQQPVSITYCYCCAGHFRFHYQIALGLKLKTREVQSSALASGRVDPCRFVYEFEGEYG